MTVAMHDDRVRKQLGNNVNIFAELFRAYMEASDVVQQGIRSMCEIINAEDADLDEKGAALSTLLEALFPTPHKGELGIDIEDLRTVLANGDGDYAKEIESLDMAQATFAERLDQAMKYKNMNQEQLAAAIGVQQPAISMMLSRKCRPQQRTVEKIAAALGVAPEQLWPNQDQNSST